MLAGTWWQTCTPLFASSEGLLAMCSCLGDVDSFGEVFLYGQGCRTDVPALPTMLNAPTLAWVAAAVAQVCAEAIVAGEGVGV